MIDPVMQFITPPPQPRYTVYAGLLEIGDTLQAGDLFGNGPAGWTRIDPNLYGLSISQGDPTVYIRPPVR